MLCTLFSFSAFADTNIVDSGSCGANLTWTLDGSGNNLRLVLSGEGAMDDYNYTSGKTVPWNDYVGNIAYVEIGDGVTSIGDMAFEYCTGIESLSIPANLKHIGSAAFRNCRNLADIMIPDTVEYVGYEAFKGCKSIASVGSGLVYIGMDALAPCDESMFEKDGSMTYLGNYLIRSLQYNESPTIRPGTTAIADWAFVDCFTLGDIVIPESVRGIGGGAFQYSGVKTMKFLGDEPFVEKTIGYAPSAKILVPDNNSTWTSSPNYDAEAQTWLGHPVEFYHVHDYTSSAVTDPDCTENGYTRHFCECGDYYDDTVVAAKGHHFEKGKCTDCGAADPDYNPGIITQIINTISDAFTNFFNSIASFFKILFRF